MSMPSAERGVEDVEAFVETGRHADVLRAAAGEHEGHAGRVVGGLLGGRAGAVLAAQLDDGVRRVGGDHDATVPHRPAPGEQRVRRRRRGWRPDAASRCAARRSAASVDRLRGRARRARAPARRRRRGRHRQLRRLFDDDVGVGAADAERADAGPPRAVVCPRRRLAGQRRTGCARSRAAGSARCSWPAAAACGAAAPARP